jgi:signal transduction histidine kinase
MFRMMIAGLVAIAALTAASAETKQGTAAEAKAMLEKAVAAVKADKAKAIAMFNADDEGFRDGDLYVFCVNAADGTETAHPTHKGMTITELKDAKGFAFGEAIMATAKDGEIDEVTYLWPRPGSEIPAKKVTYVTKVEDQVCGVGYYP